MSEMQNGVESLDTSATEPTSDAPQTAAEPSESSTEPAGENFDMLSVVRDAIEPAEDPSESPTDDEQRDPPTGQDAENDETPDDPTEAEMAAYAPSTQKRIQKLLDQRKAIAAERDTFREGAEQYQQVQNFLRDNGVTAEEAAETLQIRALMKSDPAAAWKQLKPLVQQLLFDAGEMLPPDLTQRVQSGSLNRETALELARARAQNQTGQRQTEAQEQRRREEEAQRAVHAVQSSVAQWEQSTRAKDPDFAAIQDDLVREIVFLQRNEGAPTTPQAAVEMSQRAYLEVRKRIAARRPSPQPKPQPVTGGRVTSGQPSAAPASMLDLVLGEVAKG